MWGSPAAIALVLATVLGLALALVQPPCHIISGGRIVRPGQLYVVAAQLCSEDEMKLTSSIIRSGVVVASATLDVPSGGITQIPLKVPTGITNGNYKLVVEGKVKGANKYFYNSTDLQFDSKMIAIVVQTSRPIYRASQTVCFRVLALQTDLKAYSDALDVFIVDSDGFVMRRWLSVFTNNGIISLSYRLPEYVKEGVWKIQVKLYGQVEEQKIKVENYFNPYFEVFVDMPPYARLEDGQLPVVAWAMTPMQEYVRGNITLKLFVERKDEMEPQLLWERTTFIAGSTDFQVDLSVLGDKGGDLKLEAEMTDFLYGSTSVGFCITRVAAGSLRVRFISDGIVPIKLTKPFLVSIAIESDTGHAVSAEVIENSQLSLEVEITFEDGNVERKGPLGVFPVSLLEELENLFFIDRYILDDFPLSGVFTLAVKPPPKTAAIRLRALLTSNGVDYEAITICSAANDQFGNIALYTSTYFPKVDEFSVFHLISDVPIRSFQYLVVSKDNIVNCGDIEVVGALHSTTTFSVALSSDMAPGFRLVVYAVHNGSLLTDSIFLPMSAFNRFEMELTMNNAKDFRGDKVEIIVGGDEGAYIAVSSSREALSYRLQAGNDISLSRVVDSVMSFEHFFKRLPRVVRRSSSGAYPDETRYYPAPGYGRTPKQTFSLSGLVLFTDLVHSEVDSLCEIPEMYKCGAGGCYSESQKCDGVSDCLDATDEQNCETIPEENYEFTLSRMSRSVFLFDAEDGDWGWREIKKNDHVGIEFDPVDVPELEDDWVVNAFSVSPKLGFSILESPVLYSSKRGLSAHLSGPESCRRGEQLGLRLVIMNRDPTQSLILIKVLGSSLYKFVKVGGDGIVTSYSATIVGGDQHILIYIPGRGQERLDLPIVPVVEKGPIEVHVVASSQAGRSAMRHTVEVLPEGAKIRRHTSSVMDLRSRAFALTYLDVPVEESPIVPYQVWRRYVFGSPQCSISITGDLLGPLLDPGQISLYTTLDRNAKGTDVRLFEFGMILWTLHYRRLTSMIEGPSEVRERLEHANLLYSNLMKRFNEDGYFVNWDSSHPSVWLTAWVLRVLRQAVYADWEYVLYVDKLVVDHCINWIVAYQTPEGKFVETEHYFTAPLDRRVGTKDSDSKIALTAHVLIALTEWAELVKGRTRNKANEAILNGMRYLELRVNSIVDPYCLAITVWAFYLGKSDQLQSAIYLLKGRSRTDRDSGLPYWSSIEIPSPPVKNENQRPFRGPRLYGDGDSKAVEGTSYAILSLLAHDGISPLVDNVVLWLQSMRMTSGGFISMMDSLVAVQALTEYANRARLVDVMKMDVRVNSPTDPSVDHLLYIKNRSEMSNTHVIEMKRVWGHVNVLGRGSGLALVQLEMSYGVDDRSLLDVPDRMSFGLTIKEFYSADRNKSSITVEACTKWLRREPSSSGAAALEIDLPTGYFLVESDAERVVRSGAHPALADAKTSPLRTVWLFDRIPNRWHCFNHTIRRWYAVANMTLHRGALLYETNARESFAQVLFNSTPLYTLSICEVCGSYQCPYCPYYNTAALRHDGRSIACFAIISSAILINSL